VLVCLSLAACSVGDLRGGPLAGAADFHPDERPLATTLVYDCNGYDFVARLGPGEMALWLPERYLVLPQVRSASGTLYEEGDVSFWSKGDDAMLTADGQSHQNCYLQPERVPWEDARRRGVDFRAVGNEPGWYLEVRSGRQLLFVAQEGMLRVMVPDAEDDSVDTERVYHGAADAHNLQVRIEQQPCVDTMSGGTFPDQVLVTLDGTRYQGCGQSLEYPWEDLE
jgi:putative lipoprotein